MAEDLSASLRGLTRRLAGRLETLRYLRRKEGWRTAGLALAQQIWRSAAYRTGAVFARKAVQPAVQPPAHAPSDPQTLSRHPETGLLFIGYVEASLGLGESLRGLVKAAEVTALPFAIHPYNLNVETRRTSTFHEHRYDLENRFLVNVMEMSADQLPYLLDYLGEWRLKDSYNILRTYWELPKAPAHWATTLERIDEIWAPNEFVAEAFRAIYKGPVEIVHPCVEIDAGGRADRADFALSPETFYFIFTFDYFSYPARKNPLAVLDAFQAAFPDKSERVGLIIKSTSAPGAFQDVKLAVSKAAERDGRIVVIDETLSRPELLSLIACSDAYVSLHRSEGFGLGMVEAMSLGKPVIATDFSGSRDFLSAATGFPVAYDLRPVRDREYIFSADQVWAEPRHDAAVAAMRLVYHDPDEARLRAERGRRFVAIRYGRDAVGRELDARARAIFATLGQPLPS